MNDIFKNKIAVKILLFYAFYSFEEEHIKRKERDEEISEMIE